MLSNPLGQLERRTWWKILAFTLSVVAFLRFALINGYPFIYPDTGTYIYSGFQGFVPFDRPIFYGLFLRHISLAWSLWLPIVAQSLIACYLILQSYIHIVKSNLPFTLTFFTCLALTFLSTVSIHLCLLIPDVFASFLILASAILLLGDDLSGVKRLILLAIIIFSCMVHYSNLLSFTIISAGVLIFVLIKKRDYLRRKTAILIGGIVLLMWIGIPAINSLYGFGYHYSKSTHVMTLAKMIERGILSKYLQDHCMTETLRLCSKPLPADANDFIYRTDISPLYDDSCLRTAWTECWIQREEECNKIIRDILLDPRYRSQLLKTEITQFFDQLTRTGVGIFYPQEHEEHVSEWIHEHYKNEEHQYKNSMQYKSEFSIFGLLRIHRILIFTGALFLIVWLFFNFRKNKRLSYFIFSIMLFIIANVLVCSTFIMVDARYMDRTVWLVTFSVLLVLLPHFFEQKSSRTASLYKE
jgi:hypothetical protein